MDVEKVDMSPVDKLILGFHQKQSQRATKVQQMEAEMRRILPPLYRLNAIDIHIDADGDLVVGATGDKANLKKFVGVFILNGYAPDAYPKAGDTGWCCWWRKGHAQLLFSYSSTECQRVQVGTRMQEVPVYETRCVSEAPVFVPDPQIAAPLSAPAVLVDDIPF